MYVKNAAREARREENEVSATQNSVFHISKCKESEPWKIVELKNHLVPNWILSKILESELQKLF